MFYEKIPDNFSDYSILFLFQFVDMTDTKDRSCKMYTKYDGMISSMSEKERLLVEEFIRRCTYVVIGTNHEEYGVRLSSLANLPGQSLDAFYFVSHLRSQKVVNIMGDPVCEIIMFKEDGSELIIRGSGEIVTDIACKKLKWESGMVSWYPGGPEDENFCLVRLTPESIRCRICSSGEN